MINWLQGCFTTANYSLNINGEVTGYILGQKGPRQGDPLSFYVFVIVMEVLTCLLREKSLLPDFHFWELTSVNHIQDALSKFQILSSLSHSPGKSNIYFSGVNAVTRLAILDVLKFKEGSLPV
ncbi:uncharacterized protein LOC131328445 [Rhododendron vialii]|uniref:uncharacterized protein LOC131328445 n=1 Tax=Rhododendron vialii TaxID=182163 RepID=UPI00265E01F9|nr:uncharacterized protein LOC131328445 [Rhododendron vialii]